MVNWIADRGDSEACANLSLLSRYMLSGLRQTVLYAVEATAIVVYSVPLQVLWYLARLVSCVM